MSGYKAVITGASKGIGAGLAMQLLDCDYKVIGIDREKATLSHKNLQLIEADLLDPAAVKQVADTLTADIGITHLIHNAGLIWPNLLEGAATEDIAGLAQLHLGSALQLMQAALPQMKATGFGRVVFNSSRAALGVPTRTAYGATKAAMIGMARTWALELAPHGITVNVVAPGPIQTDNFWDIVEKGSDREVKLAQSVPVGRLGTTADVVNAFLFFCDPKTSFVTGQTLYVCGGASIGALTI